MVPYARSATTENRGEAVKDFWQILTLFFLGAIFLAVLTHAKGFSTAAGTLFTGIQGMGSTLSGTSSKQGA